LLTQQHSDLLTGTDGSDEKVEVEYDLSSDLKLLDTLHALANNPAAASPAKLAGSCAFLGVCDGSRRLLADAIILLMLLQALLHRLRARQAACHHHHSRR